MTSIHLTARSARPRKPDTHEQGCSSSSRAPPARRLRKRRSRDLRLDPTDQHERTDHFGTRGNQLNSNADHYRGTHNIVTLNNNHGRGAHHDGDANNDDYPDNGVNSGGSIGIMASRSC